MNRDCDVQQDKIAFPNSSLYQPIILKMPSAPNAPQQKPADPILYSFSNGDELSKGLADFVIKVSLIIHFYLLLLIPIIQLLISLPLYSNPIHSLSLRLRMKQLLVVTSSLWQPLVVPFPKCWQRTWSVAQMVQFVGTSGQ